MSRPVPGRPITAHSVWKAPELIVVASMTWTWLSSPVSKTSPPRFRIFLTKPVVWSTVLTGFFELKAAAKLLAIGVRAGVPSTAASETVRTYFSPRMNDAFGTN